MQNKQEKQLLEIFSGISSIDDELFSDIEISKGVYNNQTQKVDDISIIENILSRLTGSGVTHKFQGNLLYITIHEYSHESDMGPITLKLADEIKQVEDILKKQYKNITGKTLSFKQTGTDLDVVSAYTVNRQALVRFTVMYELSGSKSESTPLQSILK